MAKLNILITGSAGFIGYHLSYNFLKKFKEVNVFGIDNFNPYYDLNLKKKRIKNLKKFDNFIFNNINLINQKKLFKIFENIKVDIIIHLAAQPGVRLSLKEPQKYFDNNVYVHNNILHFSYIKKVKRLLYASSSSVYGNSKVPFKENYKLGNPESLYASTKIMCENLSYAYSYNFNLKTIGLRFFTVYGPYGRPDMAYYDFTKKIIKNEKITLFNFGKNVRDFTYIDDLINAVSNLALYEEHNLFEIYNVGSGKTISIEKLINILENMIGKKALIKNEKFFKGDVKSTKSSMDKYETIFGKIKHTNFKDGLKNFYSWYNEYNNE